MCSVGQLMGLSLLVSLISLNASPLDDLSSPSPEVRSKAAEVIRENHLYTPTSRAPWDKFVASIKDGTSVSDFLVRLNKVRTDEVPLQPSDLPRRAIVGFPLDGSWKVLCVVQDSSAYSCQLVEYPKEVWVTPPSGYNGRWRTYRIDGEPVFHFYLHGLQTGPPE